MDTLEQGLRDLCGHNVEGEGYGLAHRIAADNLKLGNSVIADSVNPWELTRSAWINVASSIDVDFVNIEVICSDKIEHRHRIESRDIEVNNLKRVTWDEVLTREYHAWNRHRVLIDTAGASLSESFASLLSAIEYEKLSKCRESAL